jgi:hypothetical protein
MRRQAYAQPSALPGFSDCRPCTGLLGYQFSTYAHGGVAHLSNAVTITKNWNGFGLCVILIVKHLLITMDSSVEWLSAEKPSTASIFLP